PAVGGTQRLCTGGDVDDGEALVHQYGAAIDMHPTPVGAPMALARALGQRLFTKRLQIDASRDFEDSQDRTHAGLPSILTGERCDIARSRTKTVQPPAGAVPRRVLDPQHLRRLPRRERHIEAIEGHREAVAQRFDEGFLARPAVEESQRPVAWLEAPIRRVLVAREIACGDVVGVADLPDGFDVDADRL